MQPILIKRNELFINETISRAKNAVKQLSYFFDEVAALCEIEITPQMCYELLHLNTCNDTEQAIKEKIETDLQKTGIRIKSIREAALMQAKEDFYKLYNDFSYKRSTYVTVLNGLEVVDNKLQLRPEYENEVTEQFSVYIRTEAGEKLRQAHAEFYQAAEKFFNECPARYKDISKVFSINFMEGKIQKVDWDFDNMIKNHS